MLEPTQTAFSHFAVALIGVSISAHTQKKFTQGSPYSCASYRLRKLREQGALVVASLAVSYSFLGIHRLCQISMILGTKMQGCAEVA
jgi:hypothetical protein